MLRNFFEIKNSKSMYNVDLRILFKYVFDHNIFQHMKRMGWVKRNISDPETIAGHMYRMAMLSFLVDGKEKLDKIK